jgi:hypothetical protein
MSLLRREDERLSGDATAVRDNRSKGREETRIRESTWRQCGRT